jgi:hypothetical protein
MPIPVCIQNNILVELPKAFQDELVSSNGTKFFQDTSFRPEWNTTIKGIVASVPKKLTMGDGKNSSLDPDRIRIIPNVLAGDEIVFSYLVIMNRSQADNSADIFIRQKPISPGTTIWTNYSGLELVRIYKMNNKYECGLFDIKTKEWVDRMEGTEHDVESFMGKYMPTENVGFNYRNLLPCDGVDYWKVDYANAIAIKRGEGIFDMIGDYVLLSPIREPIRKAYQGKIEIYSIAQDTDYRATARIISIGEPLKGDKKLNVKQGDTIVTDIRYVEKYTIDSIDYWVVRQKYLYGKAVINDNSRNT